MPTKDWLDYLVTPEDEGMTVEQIIRERLSVSGRMLQRLTRSKGIRLNKKAPYLQRRVTAGDRVSVRVADKPPPRANHPAVRRMDGTQGEFPCEILYILYEDEHFLVVDKPVGILVHPVGHHSPVTLVDLLRQCLEQSGQSATPHPVHRLDKDTSGAMLVAKSGYAHQLADKLLREGTLKREYLAVVCGLVSSDKGTIQAAISRDPRHPTRRRVSQSGERAVTHYQVMARGNGTSLVRVWLETGKTHQIRVHFAHLGHPLAGDKLYGGSRPGFTRQALHSSRLRFPHPLTGVEVDVQAGLPEDFLAYLNMCGMTEWKRDDGGE